MKLLVIKSISVILTVIGIAGSVLAQDRVNPKVKKIIFEGSKVFSTFPFEKFATKGGKTHIVEVEGTKTTVTTRLLRKPVFVHTETCDPNGVPRSDGGFFFRVTKFHSYAVAGQVFAYDVDYEFFDVRSGQEVGATTGGIYLASNKKGRYIQQCPPAFKLDYIPNWVNRKLR